MLEAWYKVKKVANCHARVTQILTITIVYTRNSRDVRCANQENVFGDFRNGPLFQKHFKNTFLIAKGWKSGGGDFVAPTKVG